MYSLDTLLNAAYDKQTKLNDKALNMTGMSSTKFRKLLNKATSFDGARYLEIGVWHGSTFYSALYKNSIDYAVAIDNFSEFEGSLDIFLNNMSDIDTKYSFFNHDCFTFDKTQFECKFNIYFYDGGHTKEDQSKALTYYYDCLDDTFLYICDDFNWKDVQDGTYNGIKDCGLEVLDSHTILTNRNGDKDSFWNGVYLGILRK